MILGREVIGFESFFLSVVYGFLVLELFRVGVEIIRR